MAWPAAPETGGGALAPALSGGAPGVGAGPVGVPDAGEVAELPAAALLPATPAKGFTPAFGSGAVGFVDGATPSESFPQLVLSVIDSSANNAKPAQLRAAAGGGVPEMHEDLGKGGGHDIILLGDSYMVAHASMRPQVITYLKLGGLPVSVLVNFHVAAIRHGLRRITNHKTLPDSPAA